MAAGSSSFHRCATSFANGSSGFGAPRSACIDSRIVRICRAGDQLPVGRAVSVLIDIDGSKGVEVWGAGVGW